MRLAHHARRLLFLMASGSMLLQTQSCGDITRNSLKNGLRNWVSGSVSSIDTSQLGDFILQSFLGGTQAGV